MKLKTKLLASLPLLTSVAAVGVMANSCGNKSAGQVITLEKGNATYSLWVGGYNGISFDTNFTHKIIIPYQANVFSHATCTGWLNKKAAGNLEILTDGLKVTNEKGEQMITRLLENNTYIQFDFDYTQTHTYTIEFKTAANDPVTFIQFS